MRKGLCFLLIAAMVVCSFPALAEDPETVQLNPVVITPDEAEDYSEIANKIDINSITSPERPTAVDSYTKDVAKEADESITKAVTGDTVIINGNYYNVMLGNLLTFQYTALSNVIVLTQDLARQSALYTQLYKNPKQTADSFIDEGMHLNLFDTRTYADAYFYVYDSDIAKAYWDANLLTDDEAVHIIRYFFTLDDYFGPCNDATYGYAGGNVWLIGDARSTTGEILLCTFVNGMEIWGVVQAKTDEQYNALVDMLSCLSIS